MTKTKTVKFDEKKTDEVKTGIEICTLQSSVNRFYKRKYLITDKVLKINVYISSVCIYIYVLYTRVRRL